LFGGHSVSVVGETVCILMGIGSFSPIRALLQVALALHRVHIFILALVSPKISLLFLGKMTSYFYLH
jgi:hypothetical protein